nr:uncharacterized protein LOC123003134 [Drosophila takahashii]
MARTLIDPLAPQQPYTPAQAYGPMTLPTAGSNILAGIANTVNGALPRMVKPLPGETPDTPWAPWMQAAAQQPQVPQQAAPAYGTPSAVWPGGEPATAAPSGMPAITPGIGASFQQAEFAPALQALRMATQPQTSQQAAPAYAPPTPAPAPVASGYTPQTSQNLNWQDPRAVTVRAAQQMLGINMPAAQRSLQQQQQNEVYNGTQAGQTFTQMLAAGIPAPQAAALTHLSGALGSPQAAMGYMDSPQAAQNAQTLSAYQQQLLGHGLLTGDMNPVNQFMHEGGSYYTPGAPRGYEYGTDTRGMPELYTTEANGRQTAASDPLASSVQMTPDQMLQMRSGMMQRQFQSQENSRKEMATLLGSIYRNYGAASQGQRMLSMLSPAVQQGWLTPEQARAVFTSTMTGVNPYMMDGGGDGGQ